MNRLIRMVSLLLALMLLTAPAYAAEVFAPKDAQDAKLTALEYLEQCCYGAEYQSQGVFTRWTAPIDVYIGGTPTEKDTAAVDAFLMELALRVPTLPNIRRITDEAQSDITIYYVPEAEMADHAVDYIEGSMGYFTFVYDNYVRHEAQIVICSDKTTQDERIHLMKKELTGALGPARDQDIFSDSIIYHSGNDATDLSEFDWLLLNMMYSPLLMPGISYASAYDTLHTRYTN